MVRAKWSPRWEFRTAVSCLSYQTTLHNQPSGRTNGRQPHAADGLENYQTEEKVYQLCEEEGMVVERDARTRGARMCVCVCVCGE